MSKTQKLLDRLLAEPPPTDFTWTQAVSLMKRHNFEVINGNGSRRTFRHTTGLKVHIHEPHPNPTLLKYAITALIDGLKGTGEIE